MPKNAEKRPKTPEKCPKMPKNAKITKSMCPHEHPDQPWAQIQD